MFCYRCCRWTVEDSVEVGFGIGGVGENFVDVHFVLVFLSSEIFASINAHKSFSFSFVWSRMRTSLRSCKCFPLCLFYSHTQRYEDNNLLRLVLLTYFLLTAENKYGILQLKETNGYNSVNKHELAKTLLSVLEAMTATLPIICLKSFTKFNKHFMLTRLYECYATPLSKPVTLVKIHTYFSQHHTHFNKQ